jgi:hypothetical protein
MLQLIINKMTTWTPTITKVASTFVNKTKNILEEIYFVSESLDRYLVGIGEDECLVTKNAGGWINQNKF